MEIPFQTQESTENLADINLQVVKDKFFIEIVGLFCFAAAATPAEPIVARWSSARSTHFEVYAEAGPDRAQLVLTRFEQLRSFFDSSRLFPVNPETEKKLPTRVVEFSSRKEYDAVRIRGTADAYYSGSADRDYIVMPLADADDLKVAAHEYVHFKLHSVSLKLPGWLNEGLAELFSTVNITNRRCQIGGQLPARVETLHRHPWLSASQLFAAVADSPSHEARDRAAIFYAESWALTDMLISSPEYAHHFDDLIRMLSSSGISSQQALEKVYGKSVDTILADARDWIEQARSSRRTVLSVAFDGFGIEAKQLSESQVRTVVADLLFVNGDSDRAEHMYLDLLRQSPTDPDILASLGTISLRKGNRADAIEYWRQALIQGLANAALCYRYAVLADQMELPAGEIERALEQAIAIKPDFDDARYKLALLKSNAGEYAAAVNHLQSMGRPAGERAYGYWSALAYALSELGRRDEAQSAAQQAMRVATSAEERSRAAGLAFVARTDLAVRFARDAAGNLQLVTTRIPHGTTYFNPFIEAEDKIEISTGKLREVQCSEGKMTGLLVETQTGMLSLLIPDPLHVLVRNGPSEFNCGPQVERDLTVEFAAAAKSNAGLLRGMEFK